MSEEGTRRTRARVTVRLKPAILDPQGRAVQATLRRLGHEGIDELRVGKVVEFTIAGETHQAEAEVRRIAEEVLANPVMEDVHIALEPADADAPDDG